MCYQHVLKHAGTLIHFQLDIWSSHCVLFFGTYRYFKDNGTDERYCDIKLLVPNHFMCC